MQPAHVGHHLAYVRREELRESFRRAVAAGEARPFLFPWDFIPTFVLPILYLSISHRRRPWLYQARYLVAAAVTGLNLEMIHKTSSTNIALSYAVGVYAAWGIVWALTLLVWTKPQFEAERVQRVRPSPDLGQDGPQHKTGHGSSPIHSNGHSSNEPSLDSGPRRRKPIPIVLAPDTDVAKSLEHKFEYFWQSFPAEAPFLARLDWAFDLCLAWRGSGWSFASSNPFLPAFQRPERPLSSEPVRLDTIPPTSRSGFRRPITRRDLLRSSALSVGAGYLVLDICCVIMRQDPYFTYGPSSHPLPPHLASLGPLTLDTYRGLTAFAGVVAALHTYFSVDRAVRGLLLGPRLLGTRGELWHYPTIFGAFANVADRGLAGFWGGWWHQTFRLGFAAPARWLVRTARLLPAASPAARLAVPTTAFLQSAFMHAAGSLCSLPPRTHWWSPPLFFLAQAAGVALQTRLCAALPAAARGRVPRVGRRAGNLAFVAVWLLATQRLFVDDVSRAGLWLFEPVPVSVVRTLGWGGPGDAAVWRWDRDNFPRWHSGRHWWESGLRL